MKTVCQINKCCGCMACLNVCNKSAITIQDTLDAYNAVIDTNKCINCGLCSKVCQQNNFIELKPQISWYQGYSADESIRVNGSSGGICGAISYSFINNGGYVCSCVFNEGRFEFKLINDVNEIKKFSGSKYVKSNPGNIYKELKKKLLNNEKVLFIGLPCQVAGIKSYIGDKLQTNLYTIDLICHGTPSPLILEKFLNQYHISLKDIKNINFRTKNKFQVKDEYKSIITNGVTDKYLIAFLNSLSYTDNCYECKYAKQERVSDLTLGDSWGSNLSIEEQKKGLSLLLIQTEKGNELINQARLKLFDVNLINAVESNHQLNHPSIAPKKRKYFFKKIKHGKKFNYLTFVCFKKMCIKQDVKQILIKLGLKRREGGVIHYECMLKK